MGTPVMDCASAALNFEQGSINAIGDCGCTSALEDAGFAGEGAVPPLGDELRHEQSKEIARVAASPAVGNSFHRIDRLQ